MICDELFIEYQLTVFFYRCYVEIITIA